MNRPNVQTNSSKWTVVQWTSYHKVIWTVHLVKEEEEEEEEEKEEEKGWG